MKKVLIFLGAVLFLWSGSALALPTLQLDIAGGIYDPVTETMIASSSSFTLYALLDPTSGESAGDTYYISAALVPKTSQEGTFGSFDFAGSTINVTGGMTYGAPPLSDPEIGWDPNDLAKHGIFETYFTEFAFKFTSEYGVTTVPAYNTADGTLKEGFDLLQVAFQVDTSLLEEGWYVHFDLYNAVVKDWTSSEDIDIDKFAPFSHDAQSGPPIPEPATMLLLGTGLIGMAGVGKKKFKK